MHQFLFSLFEDQESEQDSIGVVGFDELYSDMESSCCLAVLLQDQSFQVLFEVVLVLTDLTGVSSWMRPSIGWRTVVGDSWRLI